MELILINKKVDTEYRYSYELALKLDDKISPSQIRISYQDLPPDYSEEIAIYDRVYAWFNKKGNHLLCIEHGSENPVDYVAWSSKYYIYRLGKWILEANIKLPKRPADQTILYF